MKQMLTLRPLELIIKYIIGLKSFLHKDIFESVFCGDLVYKFKRIVVKPNLNDHFKKIIKRFKQKRLDMTWISGDSLIVN